MKDTHYFACQGGGEVLWWARLSVCASVCLSASISPEPYARSLQKNFVHVAYDRGSVTKSQGKEQFWGFSSPLTMHCNAFAAKGIGRERVMGVGVHSAGEV